MAKAKKYRRIVGYFFTRRIWHARAKRYIYRANGGVFRIPIYDK